MEEKYTKIPQSLSDVRFMEGKELSGCMNGDEARKTYVEHPVYIQSTELLSLMVEDTAVGAEEALPGQSGVTAPH